MNPRNQRNQNRSMPREPKEFEEKVIEIKRLSKKTKGGNKITFSALVVIGDHKGRAGVGLDKAQDVLSAIQKSIRVAKKNLVTVDVQSGTIPHEVFIKDKSAKILLKPAPEGTGVIAGGSVRAIVESFGIRNIVSKTLGTANKTANVFATFKAMGSFKSNGVSKKEAKPAEKVVTEKKVENKEIKKVQQPKVEKKEVKDQSKTAKTSPKTKKTTVKKTAAKKTK
jgi:small subunit ribosomal protein S5